MRFAAKRDANHSAIVTALRNIGVGVHDCASNGAGMPDLLCAFRGYISLIEIKDGDKPPSARKLTDAQVRLHDMLRTHGVKVHIVENVAQALAIYGAREAA